MKGDTTGPFMNKINAPIGAFVMIKGVKLCLLWAFEKSQMALTRLKNVSMFQKMRVVSVRWSWRFSLYVISPFCRLLNGSYTVSRLTCPMG